MCRARTVTLCRRTMMIWRGKETGGGWSCEAHHAHRANRCERWAHLHHPHQALGVLLKDGQEGLDGQPQDGGDLGGPGRHRAVGLLVTLWDTQTLTQGQHLGAHFMLDQAPAKIAKGKTPFCTNLTPSSCYKTFFALRSGILQSIKKKCTKLLDSTPYIDKTPNSSSRSLSRW